jgi:hypothetical protein
VTEFHRPAQRLLVQGILASTSHLVRELRDGAAPAALKALMAERRRMLGELRTCMSSPDHFASMRALNAAVAESDRTVEALIG